MTIRYKTTKSKLQSKSSTKYLSTTILYVYHYTLVHEYRFQFCSGLVVQTGTITFELKVDVMYSTHCSSQLPALVFGTISVISHSLDNDSTNVGELPLNVCVQDPSFHFFLLGIHVLLFDILLGLVIIEQVRAANQLTDDNFSLTTFFMHGNVQSTGSLQKMFVKILAVFRVWPHDTIVPSSCNPCPLTVHSQ